MKIRKACDVTGVSLVVLTWAALLFKIIFMGE